MIEKGVVDRETDKTQAALKGKKAELRLVEAKPQAQMTRAAVAPEPASVRMGDVFQGAK